MNIIGCSLLFLTGITPGKTSLVRSDGKCGASNLLPDGNPAQCDPNGPGYCCSEWGHCGNSALHCDCPKCTNFKNLKPSGIKNNEFNCNQSMLLWN